MFDFSFNLKQDGYIRRRTSTNSGSSQAHDSQDSHTEFAAAGAPLGRNSSNRGRQGSAAGVGAVGGAAGQPRHIGDGLDHDGYRAGMPIGLLAALGSSRNSFADFSFVQFRRSYLAIVFQSRYTIREETDLQIPQSPNPLPHPNTRYPRRRNRSSRFPHPSSRCGSHSLRFRPSHRRIKYYSTDEQQLHPHSRRSSQESRSLPCSNPFQRTRLRYLDGT